VSNTDASIVPMPLTAVKVTMLIEGDVSNSDDSLKLRLDRTPKAPEEQK
jgi:hypothetical protein